MEKIILLLVFIILIGGCAGQQTTNEWDGQRTGDTTQGNQQWTDDTRVSGTGSCTERIECERMLGEGAFCSYGKCFPKPDYYPTGGVAECSCPDGTKIRAVDCRWVDCPNAPTSPVEFTVNDGIVPKTTVDINMPLSGNEAKKVAMAACGISANTSEPASPYENIISDCSPTWSFLDDTNPCDNIQAYVCAEQTIASCTFGGKTAIAEETANGYCLDTMFVLQGEYQEKFIVSNFVNLSQMREFTKFRSCAGHDYSGYNDKGKLETQRSMKQGGIARSGVTKMNIYAPFDGVVTKYALVPGHEEPEEEHFIEIRGDHSGKWFITFSHFTATEGVDFGSRVTAGEFIGTSTIQMTSERDGVEFGLNQDASTETIKELFVRGSVLDYATDDVLAEYAAHGLTPENVAFTKEYRDAHPCAWNATSANPDDFAIVVQP